MERIIYSGKKIPSRTFNRLETTMARKAQAEEMKKKRFGVTVMPYEIPGGLEAVAKSRMRTFVIKIMTTFTHKLQGSGLGFEHEA